ncbi:MULTISPECIES: acyl-CoA dehydrogenase family protein [Amycolatopsis]|uniref:Acyl-CoA dehydrogenase family protein n=1 Tax=Amycolatopsis tucumanensis TaxID=401106 RepID=A0ABP7HG95_9PSEU|nr:acyl-CoA dehydrogenase family protein [Amycolatopsis tucumanensis]MCF6423638.1 acyl-CoA dehydrogenase family protein [Amycolatopsis tucumanensis]
MSTIETDVHADFRATVRKLATKRIAPHAADVDEKERFPEEAWQAIVEADLAGLAHPEHLGGSGADLLSQVIAIEEIAAACMTTSHVLLVNWAGTCTILSHGSEELQKLVVPQVASGQAGAGWCLTEPTAGSDVAGLTTTATKVDGGWRLTGLKRFISNAPWGTWFAVLARTGESSHGVFIVHRDDPGLSFGPHERKMGLRGSPTADLVLDDCVVPDVRVVGDPTQGYRYIMAELNGSRALIAAQALGVAQGAFDAALAYTSERSQFGQSVSRFQMVRGMVADMAVRLASARALLYEAVALIEAGHPDARARAAMAKLLCSDNAMSVTTDAVQLFGGYGYIRDYPVERMMRDAKITQIYEGTNQIQRTLIAKAAYAGVGAA